MKTRYFKYFVNLLIFTFLILFIVLLYRNITTLKSYVLEFNWNYIVLLILLHAGITILSGLAFSMLCRNKGYSTKWFEWMGLSFFANFANQILPYRPGIFIRYAYLKKNYAIKLKTYVYLNFIFFTFVIISALICLLLGYFLLEQGSKSDLNFLEKYFAQYGVIGLTFFFCFICVSYFYNIYKKNLRQPFFLSNALFGPHFKGFILILLVHLLLSYQFYFGFKSLGLEIPFTNALCISGLVSLSLIVPISPGNLGVIESLMGLLTSWWYNDFALGLATALLYRTTLLMSSCAGSIFFYIILIKKIPSLRQYKTWSKQVR